jgi:hypothetical protein
VTAVAADKAGFLRAERQVESGGNYQVVNPGSGALGAYQVMPFNLPSWLADSGLPQMSGYAYLHDPAAQDRLAWVILGGYYDAFGPAGAAAMWYSGQPDPSKTYGDPPVYVYVQNVMYYFLGGKTTPPNYGAPPGGPDFTLPPPNAADWSPAVRGTAALYRGAGTRLAAAAAAISRLR